MNKETKIYSDFIKHNKVIVRKDCFVYNIMEKPIIIPLSKEPNGKWIAGDDDISYTKKSAIYYYVKNRINGS